MYFSLRKVFISIQRLGIMHKNPKHWLMKYHAHTSVIIPRAPPPFFRAAAAPPTAPPTADPITVKKSRPKSTQNEDAFMPPSQPIRKAAISHFGDDWSAARLLDWHSLRVIVEDDLWSIRVATIKLIGVRIGALYRPGITMLRQVSHVTQRSILGIRWQWYDLPSETANNPKEATLL